jgi:hypothetical protein
MNLRTTALTIIITIIAHSFTPPAAALTFEEMEEGAAAIATIRPQAQPTPDQMESAMALRNFSEGFFAIAFNPFLLSPEGEPEPIYKPSGWMADPKRCATSLLDFIARHKPNELQPGHVINPSAVFTAWYLFNCENSDVGAKFNVIFLLTKAFGPDFPGVDDLGKSIEADARQGRAIPGDKRK